MTDSQSIRVRLSGPPRTGALRVWWNPQIPGKSFRVYVDSVFRAVEVMDLLAAYDLFQFGRGIKPDYANVGGVEMLDDSGVWYSWCDDHTGEDDPRVFLAAITAASEGGGE